MTVQQLFSFKSSVKLEIKFFPLEFILFQKLKILSIPKGVIKKNVSLQKFKQLKFRELLNNKKFIKEKKYIFKFFKDLFEEKNALPKCYIYSIDEDINTSTIESNTDTINNSELKDVDEVDNLKFNQLKNNSLFYSDASRNSLNINISEIVEENEKMTLIILPPREDKNEIIIKKTSHKKRRMYRNSIDRNINSIFSDLEFGIIKEESDDDSSDKDNKTNLKKKKSIDDNEIDFSLKPTINLNLNLINDKDNDNDSDDDLKYRILKPQKTLNEKKKQNAKKSSCDYFEQYFEKEKFLEFLSGLYLININKGALEKNTIPTFRKLKIDEKKISSMGKRRKKKKNVDKSLFYNTIFSVKRLNIELGVFSMFVLGLLLFLSYLLSDTYL